jgi:RNA polymerase sigma-32 factor
VKIGTTQAQKKLFYKMKQVKNALGIDEASEEDISAIAGELDVNDDVVREMDQRLAGRDLSLNATLGNDDEATYLDFVSEDPVQESILIDEEERHNLKDDIKQALKSLNEKESYIITHRVMAEKGMTLQEIADEFGISRERVRQIEVGALKKLRNIPQISHYREDA